MTVLKHVFRVVCAGALLMVFALSAQAGTLLDTLSKAYSYNPQLDAERARLRATDEDVARANSGYRPSIDFSADAGHEHTHVRSTVTGSNETSTSPYGYSFQAVQPIFRGFQVTNAVNAAEAAVRAGREQLRLIEQQVLLDAVTSYGDVVRDQAIVRLRQSNLDFLSEELQAMNDRFSVGEVTRTDVAQAKARRAAGMSQLDLARANLEASRAAYTQVVGSDPGYLVDANPRTSLLPRSLQEAIAIAIQENPQVVAALYTEQGARYQVDQIRGELLPQAQLEATYSDRYNNSRTINETETASIVGRVNVPLYADGGEVFARVRQAKHIHVSRLQEIEQARALARAQTSQAWVQLEGFRAQIVSDRQQIRANKIALEGVREEEKVGQRTLLDVLDAQRELVNSQVQLETTIRNILVTTYSVIAAIGRLSVAEVGAANNVYVPEAHYHEVRRKGWGTSITPGPSDSDPWNTGVHTDPVK